MLSRGATAVLISTRFRNMKHLLTGSALFSNFGFELTEARFGISLAAPMSRIFVAGRLRPRGE